MTQSVDPQAYIASVMAGLTGPGGRFEFVQEDVLGTTMPVMKNRDKALGDVLAASAAYGDRDYLSPRTGGSVTPTTCVTSPHSRPHCATGTASARATGSDFSPPIPPSGSNRSGRAGARRDRSRIQRVVGAARDRVRRGAHPPSVLIVAPSALLADGLDLDVTVLTMEDDLPISSRSSAGAELRHRCRRRRSGGDPLHVRHQRAAEGRGALAAEPAAVIDYHRYSDALLAAFSGAAPSDAPATSGTCSPRRCSTSRASTTSSCRDWRPAARWCSTSARSTPTACCGSSSGRRSPTGARPDDGGPCSSTGRLALRHVVAHRVRARVGAVVPRLPAAPARKVAVRDPALVDSYGLTECSTRSRSRPRWTCRPSRAPWAARSSASASRCATRSAIRSPTAPRARSVCAAHRDARLLGTNAPATSDAIRKDRAAHTGELRRHRERMVRLTAAAPT